MKASMSSTDQIVEIDAVGGTGRTMARVWEGVSDNGVPFVAQVAWGNQECGSTVKLTDDLWPSSRVAAFAVRANGNADTLIKWLLDDAEKNGNQSIYLHLLKHKMAPAAHAADVN
jgi:hypothetical protein